MTRVPADRAGLHGGLQYAGDASAFTRDNHPKGNAETVRVLRTMNEAGLWRPAWTGPFTLARALEAWIHADNEPDLHSALGYPSPRPLARAYHASHSTQCAVA